MLDVLLQRPFYFGKKLIANFLTGLKALWIGNHASVSVLFTKYSGETDVNIKGEADVVNPYNKPKSYNTSLDGDLDGFTNLNQCSKLTLDWVGVGIFVMSLII
ncbi:MAG: hypothetical protein FJZ57_05965 [Chlamydiae bacterium]|nr:hypothetical protein [Chlamydiota bacterium]